MYHTTRLTYTVALLAALPLVATQAQEERHAGKEAKIENALAAAPIELAKNATVMDWDQTVLKEGSNGYTCLPSPPDLPGNAPMCLDAPWLKWAHAWMNKTNPELTGMGIGYMLSGDAGASNTDPFATDPSAVSDWVESGPHLMVIVPDPTTLDNFPTDYGRGTPWVMWKGTPYVHIMVPTGHRSGGHEH